MLTSLILPLFELVSIYYTFCSLLQYIHKLFPLFLCTVLTIFLQVAFIDQILPYSSQFDTKYRLLQYIYLLWQSYNTDYSLQPTILPPPFVFSTEKKNKTDLLHKM